MRGLPGTRAGDAAVNDAGCYDRDCFVPDDRHNVCAAVGIGKCYGSLEHQHIPRRSQGGRKARVMLCRDHHGAIDGGGRYEGLRIDNVLVEIYRISDRDSGEVLKEIWL